MCNCQRPAGYVVTGYSTSCFQYSAEQCVLANILQLRTFLNENVCHVKMVKVISLSLLA